MNQINVLLVEDNADLRQAIVRYLNKIGFDVKGISSAEDMYELLQTETPDILLLDINLPGDSGFVAMNKIRDVFAGILVLISAKKEASDRIKGLNLGADYYLTKPLDLSELEAVILNLYEKRIAPFMAEKELSNDEWHLNAVAWTLQLPNSNKLTLSATEVRLLEALLAPDMQSVKREDLYHAIGKPDHGPEDRTLDVLLSKIRRKVKDLGGELPLRSVRNVGYSFQGNARISR